MEAGCRAGLSRVALGGAGQGRTCITGEGRAGQRGAGADWAARGMEVLGIAGE